MKKKAAALAATAVLAVCLAGCAPAEVREAQKAIDSIGEVTLESVDAVVDANEKYDALSTEDKEMVDNHDILAKANEDLSVILYEELQGELDKAASLESSFFARYYDVKPLKSAHEAAQKAVDASDSAKYPEVYTTLKAENDAFDAYVTKEQENSYSIQTGDGKYPFAVKESEIEFGMGLNPLFKMSSDYPSNPCFFDSDTTDELPVFQFEVKDSSCIWSYKVKNTETRWINVQLEDGKTAKAFVNTKLVLSDPPESWGDGGHDLYPLGADGCYLFSSKEYGLMLAVKDLAGGEGYVLYKTWW